MSRIVFINVPAHPTAVLSIYPPVGILLISSCLKMYGHEVAYIDADIERLCIADTICRCSALQPDLIGISLNVAQVAAGAPIITALSDKLHVPIVVGGPYVTGVGPESLNLLTGVHYAILHEGEYGMVDLLEYLSGRKPIEQVGNLVYRLNGIIRYNPIERINNLDALPLPDYSLISTAIDRYQAPEPVLAHPSLQIMCTRGCPFSCSFCSSPATWGKRVTFRSTDSVIAEVALLKGQFDVHEIFFQDDTLNARPAWFMELCDKIIERDFHRTIAFKCPFRVTERLLTPELLAKAKQANFWMIFYGVESGNQSMLDKMNKQASLHEIRRAFQITKEAGIRTFASFMIGNDGETMETVKDSLTLLEEIQPEFGGFAIAAPFPGSELYRIAARKGHILHTDFTRYTFGECILRTDSLDYPDITILALEANSKFSVIKERYSSQQLLPPSVRVELAVTQPIPQLRCSEQVGIRVAVSNRSQWSLASGNPYPVHLSYHWLNPDSEAVIFDGMRSVIQVPILPDETRNLSMIVAAPPTPGAYILALTLVQEHCFWFEQHMPNLPLLTHVTVID
jgi:anaerobic magnesium-protoporphyrin IX monomethyl ester cyclase